MFLWATDLHLNYFNEKYIYNFGKSLSKHKTKGLIISGDISLGNKLERNLKTLSDAIQMSIYYVLGNHDYWYSSFAEIDKLSASLNDNSLINLNHSHLQIDEKTILIGFDGWYDCSLGSIDSSVQMTDWVRIKEFENQDPIKISKERSQSYKSFLNRSLSFKNQGVTNQIIISHIPPFEQLIKNKKTAKPFYGSSISGQMLTQLSGNFNKIICLSGHTHNRASYQQDNLFCYVGEACRGKPALAGLLDETNLSVQLF